MLQGALADVLQAVNIFCYCLLFQVFPISIGKDNGMCVLLKNQKSATSITGLQRIIQDRTCKVECLLRLWFLLLRILLLCNHLHLHTLDKLFFTGAEPYSVF